MSRKLFELILSIKRKCVSNEEKIQNELNLSQAEFNGLLALNPEEPISGNTFADRLSLSPSRGSRVLNKLATKKYVQTTFIPTDRRSVSISLSSSGLEMKNQIEKRMEACESRICSAYNKRQVDDIKQALVLLEAVL